MSRVLRLKKRDRAAVLVPLTTVSRACPDGELVAEFNGRVVELPPTEPNEPELAPEGPEYPGITEEVLKDAERMRDEILTEANQQARRILEEAVKQRDMVLEDARREGFAAGYAEGADRAAAEAQGIIDEARRVLEEAKSVLPCMLRELEPRILALCLEISRKVLGKELREDPEIVLQMARQGMRALRDEREFSLHVNPLFVAVLEGAGDRLAEEFSARSIEVVGDEEMPPDGVVVRTPHGSVDVRIETQLENLAQALAEWRQRSITRVEEDHDAHPGGNDPGR